MASPRTPQEFISKWGKAALTERAASQEHFIDLCNLLGQPTPASVDSTGAEYAFEKGVTVTAGASAKARGDRGFADVWWRGKFGWEYKRQNKHKNLDEAYRQLLQYREALENPPLLIVSDISRTEIHTNFTGTAKQVHTLLLEDFDKPETLDKLRRIFTDPASFKPQQTAQSVTEAVSEHFGTLAARLRDRGHDPHDVAHFLMKCMFCLFAEDVELLPGHLFKRLLEQSHTTPERLTDRLNNLFAAMKDGGDFGAEAIAWFNGGLFDGSPALPLTEPEIGLLRIAAAQDWSAVEPSIFGTLFERSLDPAKRSQIGAHYTSRDDIMLIVEPVVMAPLRREWDETRAKVEEQLERRRKATTRDTKKKADDRIEKLIRDFLEKLSHLRILDPACGSGNFLYVAIQQLLNLEKEVITYAAREEIGLGLIPHVRPTQLHGIEINPYAAELAQVVIWIGYLQWMRDNGFAIPRDPILEPIRSIERRDAILKWVDENGERIPEWREGAKCTGAAEWPEAEFIIGNPPFLGSKLFRKWGMPEPCIQGLYSAFDLPNTSDLCCYWFELARRRSLDTRGVRAGLLATQGIRGTFNREVLDRISRDCVIFDAHSDHDWVLDGAAVRVSMVCFALDPADTPMLDGVPVARINSNLTSGVDLTAAVPLPENADIGFMGDTKGGSFDVEPLAAERMLATPNPNGRSSFDVVRPWANGADITRRPRGMWIIDFGVDMAEASAAKYEMPFAHAREQVLPERRDNRRESYRERWWLHVEPRPAMRAACSSERFVATPNLTKHRLFVPFDRTTLPDHQLIVFARSDDYFLGVLHSSLHELWALRMGTQLEDRPRYTPTTCFETFPLPWPPNKEPERNIHHHRIAEAARALNEQRERWLNPPEWIEPIAARIDAADDFADVARVSGEEARRLIRHSAIMAAAAADPNLKKRTLTNLYNQRPAWLGLAHLELDRAVLAAYRAVDPEGTWDESWAELWQETGAGRPLPEGHGLLARRLEIEQQVLGNLLRLNQARAGPN